MNFGILMIITRNRNNDYMGAVFDLSFQSIDYLTNELKKLEKMVVGLLVDVTYKVTVPVHCLI